MIVDAALAALSAGPERAQFLCARLCLLCTPSNLARTVASPLCSSDRIPPSRLRLLPSLESASRLHADRAGLLRYRVDQVNTPNRAHYELERVAHVRVLRLDLLKRSTHRLPAPGEHQLRHRTRVLLAQCPVRQDPCLPASHLVPAHLRPPHGHHHDPAHPIKVHRRRPERDPDLLLHVLWRRDSRHLSRLGHHPDQLVRLPMVRGDPFRLDLRHLLVSARERLCRLPSRRRRNKTFTLDPPRNFSRRRVDCRPDRDRHVQGRGRPLQGETDRPLGPAVHLQPRVRGHLRRRPTAARHPNPRRPVARRRHPVRDGILGHRPGVAVRVQQYDLRRRLALPRRDVLQLALHAPRRHDGVQVLGLDHQGGPRVLGRVESQRLGGQGPAPHARRRREPEQRVRIVGQRRRVPAAKVRAVLSPTASITTFSIDTLPAHRRTVMHHDTPKLLFSSRSPDTHIPSSGL